MIRIARCSTGRDGPGPGAGPGGWGGRRQEAAPRPRGEATWPGLTRAGTVLLPNGWSLKPAGRQAKLGDFPVAIAEHPTEPVLAVLHAGYGEHEVVTLDAASGKVIARVALKESFQGLAWSSDGKRLFVGGGWDDVIYRFDHAGGLLSNRFEIKYPPGGKAEGPRRLAVPGRRDDFPNPSIPSLPQLLQLTSLSFSPHTLYSSPLLPPPGEAVGPSGPGRPGRVEGRRDALGRQRLRPHPGEVRRRGEPPGRARPRGRLLPLRPGLGRGRAAGSTSASGPRPRSPSSTRPRARSSPAGPRRSIPTSCS